MALFQHRRRRSHRASLKSSATLRVRLNQWLQNENQLLRLAVCLVALVGCLVVVEAWRAPFPYRLGDRPVHGLAARVEFQRENELQTRRMQEEIESQVPFFFDGTQLEVEPITVRFRLHLSQIAKARDLTDLPIESIEAFELAIPAKAEDSVRSDKASLFATLKSAVDSGGGSSGNRIDELAEDLGQFLEALDRTGVIAENEISQNDIPMDASLAVLSENGEIVGRAIVSERLISELIKDTGQLGKSWNQFPRLVQIQSLLETWLINQVQGTLKFNQTITLARRDEARDDVHVYDSYEQGRQLVAPGEVIGERMLGELKAEYDAIEATVGTATRITRVGIVVVLLGVLMLLFTYYLLRFESDLISSARRIAVYLGSIVLTVGLARALSHDPWRAEIIPIICTTMFLAIAYNQVLATLTAFAIILITTLSTMMNLGEFVVLMSVASFSVINLRSVSSRSSIIKVGFFTAMVCFTVSVGYEMIRYPNLALDSQVILPALKSSGWCLVAGYLVAGSLPFVESAFGFVTDISLLELSDVSHPLLRELVQEAPGTYNHSIAVATIGEAAADRIGANGLLVRVAAYYHDIGKMIKPRYFVENLTEESSSKHKDLAPAMSTLIIIGHVKDGVDLARSEHLPQPLIDFIEQHHGTTLVEYFYEAATRLVVDPDHRTDAEESSFRYPGPKPQTREAGVMMMADAVESASRTLSDPTPKRIESLVHEVIMKRLLDGQFDESSLTLTEIRTIEESLIKSLIGIYHGRIKYPEQQTA